MMAGRRPHGSEVRGGLEPRRADLFDLQGDHGAVAGKVGGGVGVVERRGDEAVDHGVRGAVGRGIERVHGVAHRARGQRRHPPELPTAQDADGGAGRDGRHFAR